MPLTNTTIRNAKPSDKAKRLFDGGGLYLEVAPSGGKWWRLKYRFGGKEKRLSLGVYPDVTLKDARIRRDEARKLLANDIDPSENRKTQKAANVERGANSFEVIAREWFTKYSPSWSETHSTRIIRRLERDIFPWLGGKAIAEITAQQLLAVIRRIEERGALETSHRALSDCGRVFRYAVATGRAERDPSGDLRGAIPITKVNRFFGWPFLLVVTVLNLRRYGFTKIAGSNFERAFSARLRRSEIHGCISSFPPSPPITKAARFLGSLCYWWKV